MSTPLSSLAITRTDREVCCSRESFDRHVPTVPIQRSIARTAVIPRLFQSDICTRSLRVPGLPVAPTARGRVVTPQDNGR
ncbi:hypothetical protein [Kibdelosporangium philippinense]|uniref:hypothetical protein n=1 Tax=Kibdelosporangium philippinense TaxID=211113 RepID=UPI0036151102